MRPAKKPKVLLLHRTRLWHTKQCVCRNLCTRGICLVPYGNSILMHYRQCECGRIAALAGPLHTFICRDLNRGPCGSFSWPACAPMPVLHVSFHPASGKKNGALLL